MTTGTDEVLFDPSTHDSLLAIAPIMDIKRMGTTAIAERFLAEFATYFFTPTPATIRSTAATRSATSLPAAGNLQISVLNTRTPYKRQITKIVHSAKNQGISTFSRLATLRPEKHI